MSSPEPTQEQQPLSYDTLDLRAVAGTDRTLDLPTVDGWQSFPISGDLSIPTMARIFILDKQLDEAETGQQMQTAFEDALTEIMRIVRVRTPDAPDIDPDEFGVKRISATLAWISGDVSVANAVASTLTAGLTPEETEKAVATAHAASGEDGQDGEGGADVPLASKGSSSTPSSSLDGSTVGDRSGGEQPAGDRSASTSPTPEPATA